ncbi:MAG: RluA family pseudouridine synthase [Tissierellia bacterium]|nr:RluA family pseudouridine synthase [Tissierellia bacterium]
MDLYKFIVEEESGERLDVYIADQIEDLSRSFISKLIKKGLILVNGEVKKPKYIVKKGDLIQVDIPERKDLEPYPEDIPLDIIYEDDDIIVVNKPKGMVVHPAPGSPNKTLVNALLNYTNDLSDINGKIRPGIVHRLDKDTSGVLVVAKNNKAHMDIAKQLKERSIKRIYIALVHGVLNKDEGVIDAPIGRNPRNRLKMAVTHINSKEAITRFKVLERFSKYTLVELSLYTGRTHQIRVHLSYINHPVVGDSLYTNRKNEFGIKTQMLHALKLGLKSPSTGEYMEFEAKPLDEFTKVLEMLRKNDR